MAKMARMTDRCFSPWQREQLEDLGATVNTDIEILLEGKYGNKLVRFGTYYNNPQYYISWG